MEDRYEEGALVPQRVHLRTGSRDCRERAERAPSLLREALWRSITTIGTVYLARCLMRPPQVAASRGTNGTTACPTHPVREIRD